MRRIAGCLPLRLGSCLLGPLTILALILALWIPASTQASFSGQNGKIFFQGPQSGTSGPADVFSINPDGSEKLDITLENGFSDERPSASADGRHVVFQSFRDEGWNIFSIDADGSNPTNLTKTKDPVINFEPAWSPDGSKVAFMRQGLTVGEQDIWVVNANGTNPVDITNSPGVEETAPEFSPDGTKIAYIGTGPKPCCDPGYNNDIWVMNSNGSNPTQLTTTDFPTQNIAPAWSPDGLTIAYSTTESPGAADNGIHVMNANGTNQHRLLPGGTPILTGGLSWSPDGTKIVYESSGGSLSIMSSDGTGSSPLVSNSGASYPSWVPAAAPPTGGGSTPLPPAGGGAAPVPAPSPKPKPLACKKGFKRKVVKGKARCVRKHKRHRRHRGKPTP